LSTCTERQQLKYTIYFEWTVSQTNYTPKALAQSSVACTIRPKQCLDTGTYIIHQYNRKSQELWLKRAVLGRDIRTSNIETQIGHIPIGSFKMTRNCNRRHHIFCTNNATSTSGPTCRLTKLRYLHTLRQYLFKINLRLLLILTFQCNRQ
jgi:hypothetical protein